MSRKATSMRGEVVDFDLFAIKEQISGAPVTETIQNRERFIELRRRRGTKRKIQDMIAEQESANVNNGKEAEDTVEEKAVTETKRKIVKKESK